MPLTNLAVRGSSIPFAADQLLRSDIREKDLIVWGLTYRNRLSYIVDGKLEHINAHNVSGYTDQHIDFVPLVADDHNLQYQSLIHIHQVINFANKIKANILLVGLCCDPVDELFLKMLSCYLSLPTKKFVDWGTDGRHPGPNQHKIYADTIQKHLYTVGII
jgi:hypothetical protein